MKKIVLIVCFLLLSAGVCLGREVTLENRKLRGVHAKNLEQVLRLEPGQIDLATAALIASERWSDIVAGRRYLAELDEMAREIRRRLDKNNIRKDHRAITIINKYLFDELSFDSIETADDPNDLFLHTVLDKRRGYCLSLSVLYLAIGERLGLPLHGVVVPGHFFVRYDDGRVNFNIETTSGGGYADDEHYRKKFKVPAGSPLYLKNLNKRQVLGCFFNNLGNSYTHVCNFEQAAKALIRAVEINPSLAESRSNLGNIYLQFGQVDEAIEQYRASLAINGGDAKTHNNLGNAYLQKDWIQNAIDEYRQCIEAEPDFVDAYKNIAIAYGRRKMFNYSVRYLKDALRLTPEDAKCYKQLGDAFLELDQVGEAMYHYEKSLQYEEDFAEAWYGLGVCHHKQGERDEAIEAYMTALRYKPDHVGALTNLGNAYFERKQWREALRQYEVASYANPQDGLIHYNIGAAYSNLEEHEEAVAEYEKCIELVADMPDAHKGLAYGYYRLEKYDLACEYLREARRLGAKIEPQLAEAIEEQCR